MTPYLSRLRRPARIAHRGGALLFPENTLLAFQGAVALGVDALELDVQLTRDGEVVVLHDEDVARTTDGQGDVAGLTLAELSRLDAAAKFDGGRLAGRGIRIPTLRELFTALPAVPMNIEVKTDSALLVERFAALVKEFGREELVCASSGLDAVAERMRAALPGQCTFFPEVAANEAVFSLKGLEIGGAGRWPWDILEIPFQIAGTPIVDAALVAAAHARGIAVQVWVLDTEREIQAALSCGVDGIMTDDPRLLMALCR